MKEITLKLYSYDELKPEAQQRALEDWNKYNDDPFMQPHMINLLKEKLEERGITYDADSIDVRYSLSHCQGDGFMFEGRLQWKGHEIVIKHSGHYYHSYSKEISWYKNDEEVWPTQGLQDAFEKIYQAICKEMEQIGYEHIEWITSAENFSETCDANEYTFEEDGTMRNE